MRSVFRSAVLCLAALNMGSVSADAATPGAAQFKGYFATNSLIKNRLVKSGDAFSLIRYLGEECERCPGSLASLLGSYSGAGIGSQFQNGEPNVANLLLWHLALSELAKDLGKACTPDATPTKLNLNPGFLARLKPLCAWPAPEAKTEETLFGYWEGIMSYDAPYEEFLEWKQFALGDAFAKAPAPEAIAALSMAIFYNPYFLLED